MEEIADIWENRPKIKNDRSKCEWSQTGKNEIKCACISCCVGNVGYDVCREDNKRQRKCKPTRKHLFKIRSEEINQRE